MRDNPLTRRPQRIPTPPPEAVIIDIDGSVADISSALIHLYRSPKDWDAFHAAVLNCPAIPEGIRWAQRQHEKGRRLLVITGRNQSQREGTFEWLSRELSVPFLGPFCRADGDRRQATVVKAEIMHRLSSTYRIVGAIEDDPKVIEMWERMGLKVKVGEGRKYWDHEDAYREYLAAGGDLGMDIWLNRQEQAA